MESILRGMGKRKIGWAKAALSLYVGLFVLFFLSTTLYAAGPAPVTDEYRTFLGLSSRNVIWFVAEVHLMFGAFVLGVPIFAVTLEAIGAKTKDARYDRLAYELPNCFLGRSQRQPRWGGFWPSRCLGCIPALWDICPKSFMMFFMSMP